MNEQNNMPPSDNAAASAQSSDAGGEQQRSNSTTADATDGGSSSNSASTSSQQQQGYGSTQQRRHRRGGGSSTGGGSHEQRRQGQRDAGSPSSTSSGARRPEASVNMEEVRELVDLIAERGFTDFELEREGFRIRLRREVAGQQSGQQIAPAPFANPFMQHTSATMPSSLPTPATPTSNASAANDSTQTVSDSATAASSEQTAAGEDLETIKSPIVGTFYRSPSPTAESFVKVGSGIEPSTVVCIVEAMKLMNEILAETSGTIEKIYVENGQPVEYGQPLFGVRKN